MIKLIVTDIDNTLTSSAGVIEPETAAAVKKASLSGIKVVLASGRLYPCISWIRNALELDTPVIASNGAYITDGHSAILLKSNSVDDVLAGARIARDFGVGLYAYTTAEAYTVESLRVPEIERMWETLWGPGVLGSVLRVCPDADDMADKTRDRCTKLLFVSIDGNARLRAREALSHVFGARVASSEYYNIELLPVGADKGRALTALCAALGISVSECMAIGDGENDKPMIEAAGVGVAMGNAAGDVKEAADYVTLHTDDFGFANAVGQFALI